MTNTTIINFFAGPGVGKSTLGALLFGILKMTGYEVEYVPEFAKILTWANHTSALKDSLYIFAKQDHRLEVLRDHPLDFIITDSPLLTPLLYTPEGYYGSFESMVLEVFNSYNNLNILLERVKPYYALGRNQTEEEARAICSRVKSLLVKHDLPFTILPGDETAAFKAFALATGMPLHEAESSALAEAVKGFAARWHKHA